MNAEICVVAVDSVLPLRHQVLWPDMPFEFVKVPEDASAVHLAIQEDGEVVCVISLFEEKGLRFRKFATTLRLQGRGYGTAMMQYVIDYALEKGFSRLWCDAREDALDFYARFGFRKCSEIFYKGEIPYFRIEKMIRQEEVGM